MQAPLVVVDEHARGDMHRAYKGQSLTDAAFAEASINLGRDIDEPPAAGNVEPEFLLPGRDLSGSLE